MRWKVKYSLKSHLQRIVQGRSFVALLVVAFECLAMPRAHAEVIPFSGQGVVFTECRVATYPCPVGQAVGPQGFQNLGPNPLSLGNTIPGSTAPYGNSDFFFNGTISAGYFTDPRFIFLILDPFSIQTTSALSSRTYFDVEIILAYQMAFYLDPVPVETVLRNIHCNDLAGANGATLSWSGTFDGSPIRSAFGSCPSPISQDLFTSDPGLFPIQTFDVLAQFSFIGPQGQIIDPTVGAESLSPNSVPPGANVVPEASTLALLSLSLPILGLALRRRIAQPS